MLGVECSNHSVPTIYFKGLRDFISRPLFILLRFYPYKTTGSGWNPHFLRGYERNISRECSPRRLRTGRTWFTVRHALPVITEFGSIWWPGRLRLPQATESLGETDGEHFPQISGLRHRRTPAGTSKWPRLAVRLPGRCCLHARFRFASMHSQERTVLVQSAAITRGPALCWRRTRSSL